MRHRTTTLKCPALLLAMLLTAALSGFTARAAQLTAVRTYDTSAVTLGTRTAPDGTQFQTVEWGDLYPAAEVGSPELPVEHFRFLVPVYTNNFRATVVSATGASALPLVSRLMPRQVPQELDGSPAPEFTYPKAPAYAQSLTPEAWVVDDGFIDGCNHVVTVAVRPVSYDDATLSASAYGSVTVRLDYDLCDESGLTGSTPIFPPHASRYVDIGDLVVNTADVARFAPRRAPEAKDGDYGKNYYIIVPEDLEDAVEDLRIWKRQKGYNVIVKTIEDICATPRYSVGSTCVYEGGMTEQLVDSAASLRAYLHDEFDANGAYFCLLVGNSKTSMPIRKGVYSSSSSLNINGEEFTPTDWYFSDLTTEYSLKSTGIPFPIYAFKYNKYTSDSEVGLPDIYVGRLLAYTSEDICNYLRKLISYEANPGKGNTDYLTSALFFEQYKDGKDGAGSLIGDSKAVRDVTSSIFATKLIQSNKEGTYATGKELIAELRNSCGLFSPHAHGNPYGFGTALNSNKANPHGSFFVTSEDKVVKSSDDCPWGIQDWQMNMEDGNGLDNLHNKDCPFIIYSISCDNTPFDIKGIEAPWYNLGESFTCGKDYGGPAFLGNTRVGIIGESVLMEAEFLKFVRHYPKIGIGEALSKTTFNPDSYKNHIILTHNLVGEPEFEMWLGKPKKFENLHIDYTDYGLNLNGSDLVGAKVSTYTGADDTRWTESAETEVELVMTSQNSDMVISVWKTGYLPFIELYSLAGTILNKTKKYFVQNATLGNPEYADSTDDSKMTKIGSGTVYTVNALESITAYKDFIVDDGAEVILDCDKTVELSCTVKAGGKLTVRGKDVKMASGFNVEKGGVFNMEMK